MMGREKKQISISQPAAAFFFSFGGENKTNKTKQNKQTRRKKKPRKRKQKCINIPKGLRLAPAVREFLMNNTDNQTRGSILNLFLN